MLPSDLGAFTTVSDPRLHPDGVRIAFATSRMDLDTDRYHRSIWLWDGSQATVFTEGESDSAPRWSPDGERLAFLRGDEEGKNRQVWVMPAAGGEPRRLTELALGFETLEWSPDGSRLAGLGSDWTDEWARLDETERKRRPKRITYYPFRFDNRGWLHDKRRHLYLVDPQEEALSCLTPGEFEETDFAWRPDAMALVFFSARHPDWGIEPGVSVYEVGLDGGEPNHLLDRGSWVYPTYSPDGLLHLIGSPDPWAHPTVTSVWRMEASGALTDLTGHLDRNVHWVLSGSAPDRPQWIGSDFVALMEDRGRNVAIRVDREGRAETLIGGDRIITGVSPSSDGARIAFAATASADPGELHLWENQHERVLTGFNEEFRAQVALSPPRPFVFESGGAEVDAWAYLPEGNGPFPLLLNIHGGPASQYGYGFFDEFQVYAGAGYGVLACNPRGSTGRGRDFLRAVTGDGWGTADLQDVTACVDQALLRFPQLDASRVGVMGGSYGGFLTAWLVAHDQRYRSAIVERALLGWESFAGTSDIGATFSRRYLDADLPEGRQLLAERSPLNVAHRITTPTLILHSENDFRCPIEQAEQLFMTLLKAGTDVEMVRFPDEGHELSRSGKPRHRRERLEIVVDWHNRHLAPEPGDVGT